MTNQADYLINILAKAQGIEKVEQDLAKLGKLISSTSKDSFDEMGTKTGTILSETFSKGVEGGIEFNTVTSKIGTDGVKSVSAISKEFQKATPLVNELGLAMKRAFIVAPVWMLARNLLMSLFNTIGENIKFLTELETAMARINIVGEDSAANYTKMKVELLALATAYGVSGLEAMKTAELFTQQGRNAKEAAELTRTAMLGAVILGEEVSVVADDLTAAIMGFNIPVEQSISIIDKWVNVSRKFAVTSKDLAEATKTAGASANQLGVSIDAFLGDITAIIEVTRRTGSQAANALQFIYARLTLDAAKSLEQLAQVPVYLDKNGNSTFELTGVNRSLSSILTELSGKWETLGEKEKKDIALKTGSKRQMNAFMALMQNYDRSLEANIISLGSAGAAYDAFAIKADTVAFKQEQVTANFNQLTDTIANTGAWKGLLDTLNKVSQNLILMISLQRGVQIESALAADELDKDANAYLGVIDSIKGLIAIRNDLLKAKKTPSTTKNLALTEETLSSLLKKNPQILIDINANPTEIYEKLNLIRTDAEKQSILQKIVLKTEFDDKEAKAKYRDAQKSLATMFVSGELVWNNKKIKDDLKFIMDYDTAGWKTLFGKIGKGFSDAFNVGKTIKKATEEVSKEASGTNFFSKLFGLTKNPSKTISDVVIRANEIIEKNKPISTDKLKTDKQNLEVTKQLELERLRNKQKYQDEADEEAKNLGRLTESDKERLELERQLTFLKESGLYTTEQQLAAEIALTANADALYEKNGKALALAKLQNEAAKQQVQNIGRQVKSVNDIILAYSKADPFKKIELRRLAELQTMSPQAVKGQYETNEYDRNLILDNIKSFSEEVQNTVTGIERTNQGFDDLRVNIGEFAFTLNEIKQGLPKSYGLTTGQVQAAAPQLFPNVGAASNIPGASNVVSNASLSFNTTIGAINVALAPETFDKFLDEVGSKVVEELRGNEQLKEEMAKLLRDKI